MQFRALALFVAATSAAHIKLSFTLQESFAATNAMFYQLYKDGKKLCDGTAHNSGDFGKPIWDVQCKDKVHFHVNMDAGARGKATVKENGNTYQLTLKANGLDHQFGCG